MSSGIKRYLTMGVRYDGLKTMVNVGTNFQKKKPQTLLQTIFLNITIFSFWFVVVVIGIS